MPKTDKLTQLMKKQNVLFNESYKSKMQNHQHQRFTVTWVLTQIIKSRLDFISQCTHILILYGSISLLCNNMGQNISITGTVHAVILWTAWNGRLQLVYMHQKKIHICTGSAHVYVHFAKGCPSSENVLCSSYITPTIRPTM
jgi:hypothetical protein